MERDINQKYNLEDVQVVLKSQINVNDVNISEKIDNLSEIILELSVPFQYFEYNIWSELFSKYLVNVSNSLEVCKLVFDSFKITNENKDERFVDNEEGADLYKGEFSLAYGAFNFIK